MVRQARCCCGETTISVEGEPEGICHCDDCRRRTGSAFGWSAYFPNDRIVGPTGGTSLYRPPGDATQERHFCQRCGSTLFWKTGALPGSTGIAGGAFVDTPLAEPSRSYRSHRRHAWVELPPAWEVR